MTFGVETFHVTCVSTILANKVLLVTASSFHIIDPSFLVIFCSGRKFRREIHMKVEILQYRNIRLLHQKVGEVEVSHQFQSFPMKHMQGDDFLPFEGNLPGGFSGFFYFVRPGLPQSILLISSAAAYSKNYRMVGCA